MAKSKPGRKPRIIILSIITIIIIAASVTILFIMKPWEEDGVILDNAPVIGTPGNTDPFADSPIQVIVSVTDDFGVDSVILSFTTDIVVWQNTSMTGIGTTSWTGSAFIPAQDIETTILYQIYANDTSDQWSVNNNNTNYYHLYTGARKAFLVCSANDFSSDESEDTFNGSPDGTLDSWTGNWEPLLTDYTLNLIGGKLILTKVGSGYGHANLTYNWEGNSYILDNYAEYNMTVELDVTESITGPGVRIGLQWLNSTGSIVRTDWSEGQTSTGSRLLNITGICNNQTNNEITNVKLIMDVEGISVAGGYVYFDNVLIHKNFVVNVSNPFDGTDPPPPPFIDADGFPAQTLQEYWILKDKGYTDENIFLMLYHTNDAVIDIYAFDGIANDLTGAVVDVENNDVNASRFKRELNASIAGSFASTIQQNDQLIIAITDHGSNAILADGNATFHFEADNSFITEFEFFDLLETFNCSRMMINIDCCFSGNFIQSNPGAFYDVPNAIMISAADNVFSWYWINNQNGDGFAGSWFFNKFWEQLELDVFIGDAFGFALNFIPFGKGLPLAISQMPLICDPNNWASSWSFTSIPKL